MSSEDAKARLAAVPDVDIDKDGKFKYILIKLYPKSHQSEDDCKYLVRGYAWAGFHGNYCIWQQKTKCEK